MKFLFTLLLSLFSISLFAQDKTANDTIKQMKTELDEVVLEKKKKAVERKADRVIFDFSEQAHLNSGSLMEGLKKLPGLIISDVAGMMYQGKGLQVYMDGRPLNIYSQDLNAYLEGMPANAIEKVEIITHPGAEFPATSGGAIINIISSKKAQKYLSATYSNGYSYTKYDDSRHRFNNSLTLNSGNNLFNWQVNAGQSYSENYQTSEFFNNDYLLSRNLTDRNNRYYYLKTGLKFDFKLDRLLINYDITNRNTSSYINAQGEGFVSDDKGKSKNFYNDVMVTYQKRFEDPYKKLDFRINYNNNNGTFDQDSRLSDNIILNNDSNQDFYQFKTDYSQQLEFLDKTKISTGVLADKMDFKAKSFDITNLDYSRTTLSLYGEGHTNYKDFEFIVGGRLESYDIHGTTGSNDLIPFKQTRFFPNALVQYNVMPQVHVNASYNKKISLPNTSALNPNNTNYQNPNLTAFGNPFLQPTIYNNYELELNAFEYFFINYSITDTNNQIINRVINTENGAAITSENVDNATTYNFNFGIPIPFMLFTKGLKETLEFNFNPDEINFLFLYMGNHKNVIPGLDSKSVWNLNVTSQIILPAKIKFTASYGTTNTGGYYNYYVVEKALNQRVDLTFSKKFLSDNLSVSVYVNDLLNTVSQNLSIAQTNLLYNSQYDSRSIGFSLNYKIPTKNKLAKEEDNLLNSTPKQEENTIGN